MVVLVVERLTYADSERRSSHLARGLIAEGVGKGTRVGILMPNGPDWVLSWLAASRIGALVIPLSTFSQARELHWLLHHADIDTLVCADAFLRHAGDDVVLSSVELAQLLGAAEGRPRGEREGLPDGDADGPSAGASVGEALGLVAGVARGLRVGLLDLDICGPSVPHLLGLRGHRVGQALLAEPAGGTDVSTAYGLELGVRDPHVAALGAAAATTFARAGEGR